MAERNPPLWEQAGSHSAENDRLGTAAQYTPGSTTNALQARGGVRPFGLMTDGTGPLSVTNAATPNNTVVVAPGVAVVPGTETTYQGAYICANDSSVVIQIAAASTTNPRSDLIVARVRDAQYSGTLNLWALEAITGTPAATPIDPVIPANCIVLARVRVNASAGSTVITASNVTDVRQFVTGLGGTTPSKNATDVVGVYAGQQRYRLDTGAHEYYNGTAWISTARTTPGYWSWGGPTGYGPFRIPNGNWTRAPGATGYFVVTTGHVYQLTSHFTLLIDQLGVNVSGQVRSSIQTTSDVAGSPSGASGDVLVEGYSLPATWVASGNANVRSGTGQSLTGFWRAPFTGPVWFTTCFATDNTTAAVVTAFASPITFCVDLGLMAPFVDVLNV